MPVPTLAVFVVKYLLGRCIFCVKSYTTQVPVKIASVVCWSSWDTLNKVTPSLVSQLSSDALIVLFNFHIKTKR